MWAFKSLWDKGLIYEGFRVLAYCWRCETPLSNTETRMDDVYRDRQDPALTVAFELLDGPGRAPGCWPGRRRRGRCRPTSRSPSGRTSTTRSSSTTAARYVLADRRGSPPTQRRAAARPRTRRDRTRRRARRPPLPAAVRLLRRHRALGTERAFQVLAGDFVSTDEGTGIVHLAPGLRRGRPDRLQRASASRRSCRWTSTAGTPREVPDWAGDARLRRQPARSSARSRSTASSCATRPTTTPTRTAGAARSRSSTGPSRRGSSRSPSSATAWSSSTSRSRGCPSTSSTAASASGWRTPATGRSAATASGARRSRCGAATIPTTRGSTSTARSPSWRPTSASPVTDLHRPMVDELVRPNPDDPTGRSMMRRVPEVLDCWFESGSMPFAQVHYPFENREWFEDHFPGDFIVEYTGQTRGWFYTLHVLATALFDRPAFRTCVSHGIVLGDGRPEDVQEPAQLPGPDGGLRHPRRRRDALVPAVVADPARQRLLRHGRPGCATRPGRCCCRCGTPGTSSPCTPTSPGTSGGSRAARRASDHVLDRYVLAKTRRLVEDMTDGDGRLRPVRRLRQRPRRSSTCSPTGTSAAAGSGSGTATATPSTRCTPCSTSSRGSPRRCCRTSPTRSTPACTRTIADDGRQRAPHATGPTPTSCPPTTSWWPRWTRCATSARPRCRCARPTAAGCASRWPR